MSVKAMDLFDAYSKDLLPKDQAYIVSSFVDPSKGYIKYEIVSYSAVKAIYPEGTSLTFQSQGKKMHILIEPSTYPKKAVEPYLREKDDQIPLRFSELKVITAKNQTKIYIAKKPMDSLSSFTVTRPTGMNISFLFYQVPELYDTLTKFFEQSLNRDAHIPQSDAKKAAQETIKVVKEQMAFTGEFQ